MFVKIIQNQTLIKIYLKNRQNKNNDHKNAEKSMSPTKYLLKCYRRTEL